MDPLSIDTFSIVANRAGTVRFNKAGPDPLVTVLTGSLVERYIT
jgi:hypothetical protein